MAGLAKKGKAHQLYFYLFGKRQYIYLPKIFPKREVQKLKSRVEELVFYREYEQPLPPDLEAFISNLAPKIRKKLERTGLLGEPIPRTLGELTEAFLAFKEGGTVTEKTLRGNRNGVTRLLSYFGEEREAHTITTGDIEAWKVWLKEERGLAEATVGVSLQIGRSVWLWAKKKGYLKENVFEGVKKGNGVTEKKRHVSLEEYRQLLDVCPSQSWRTLLALCRIGGLRNPSETFLVTWGDIDWDRGTLVVHSPKTERVGKGSRIIPLFPELREELESSWELAEEGEEKVLAELNPSSLSGQMRRIMKRSGVEPWSRVFHNLRGSRDDELFSAFPEHVAAEWMGHSSVVARKHYLKATQDQIRDATQFVTGDGNGKSPSNSPPFAFPRG